MALAADGQDGNGLQLEKFTLNFSSCSASSKKKNKVDINGCNLLSHLRTKVIYSFRCSEKMLCMD